MNDRFSRASSLGARENHWYNANIWHLACVVGISLGIYNEMFILEGYV
jgi:hypothetical protein